MEIIEAQRLDQKATELHCDVCVIGAGAAGLYLSTQLARSGISVVVLEAGGRFCKEGAHLGIETLCPATSYRGSTDGRYFGLGGSTARWGGLTVSHSDLDLRKSTSSAFDPWCHVVRVVNEEQRCVAKVLGLDVNRRYEEVAGRYLADVQAKLESRSIRVVAAEFLPFRRKNLAFLLNGVSNHDGGLRCFLGAVACHWEHGGDSRIASVTAKAGDRLLKIRAKSFVVAAGAIESSRILLELERQLGPGCLLGAHSVGRCLSDHLSCPIARVIPHDVAKGIELFAPRFLRGRMRSFRFLDGAPGPDVPRAFAHFIFLNDNPGFAVAKKLLASLQARKLERIGVMELMRGTLGLFRLGWQRYCRSRLYIDSATAVHLQLDVEQAPNRSNGISLTDSRDACGRFKAKIDWCIRSDDFENIEKVSRRFLSAWPGRRANLPDLREMDVASIHSSKPHDAYHPVGTCRLGTDSEAVVTPDLCVRGIENLFVLSTSVFPTAGTANPTFSMLCLGNALGKHIVSRLRS